MARADLKEVTGDRFWKDADLDTIRSKYSKAMPSNVRHIGHVYTRDHNAFNCTPLAVLNVNRESMARYGFSPPTRVFEAAGAGACLITDAWEGVEQFLEPGSEVLVAHGAEDVAGFLRTIPSTEARRIGTRARARLLGEHTYAQRALQFEQVLGLPRRRATVAALGRGSRTGEVPAQRARLAGGAAPQPAA